MKVKKVVPEVVVTVDGALSKKFNIELAAMIRALHEDLGQRVKDESTKTQYISKFILKVNNTLLVTKVVLNKDPKKSHELEAHT